MDPSTLTALLAFRSLRGVGEAKLGRLLIHCRGRGVNLQQLWQEPDELASLGLHSEALQAIRQDAAARWREAESRASRLFDGGVEALTCEDPDAPEFLRGPATGRSWPAVLTLGAAGLLERGGAAFLCSRDAAPAHLAFADACADAAARRGVTVVASPTGAAYQAAAIAAKRQGGSSIYVLDRDITPYATDGGFIREPVATARVWDGELHLDSQCIVTPVLPGSRWTPRHGPSRDQLLADLSRAIVAVHVRPGGGMELLCRTAAARGVPLLPLADALSDLPRPPLRRKRADAESVADWLQEQVGEPAAADAGLDAVAMRELGQFMVRLCRLISGERGPVKVAAHPLDGLFAATASAWSAPAAPADGGWLLADLRRDFAASGQRILRGLPNGSTAACLLSQPDLERVRLLLLRGSLPGVSARLLVPLPELAEGLPDAPAVLVVSAGGPAAPLRVIETPRRRMGRFTRRRFFQEVLAAVAAPPSAA